MVRRFLLTVAGAAVALVLAAPAAQAWSDLPASGIQAYPCTPSVLVDCAEGSYRLEFSWGLGDPLGDGETAKLYRAGRKKGTWVPVPATALSMPTRLSGVGNHTEVFPDPAKFVPGTYMLAFTENRRAQWKCSKYWKDICRWVDASSTTTMYRFTWSGTALEPGLQVKWSFR